MPQTSPNNLIAELIRLPVAWLRYRFHCLRGRRILRRQGIDPQYHDRAVAAIRTLTRAIGEKESRYLCNIALGQAWRYGLGEAGRVELMELAAALATTHQHLEPLEIEQALIHSARKRSRSSGELVKA